MVYNGKLSVCLLDLQLGGLGLHPKGIVVSKVCDHLGDFRIRRSEGQRKERLFAGLVALVEEWAILSYLICCMS